MSAMNRPLSHIILIGTLIILIGALAVFALTRVSGERHIAEQVQALPHPDGVVLVYDLIEQSQGSRDACFITSFSGLYGTDRPYEEVATFYKDYLIADGWQRVDPDWRPNNGLFFEHKSRGFYLSIETEVHVSYIPEDTIETAQAQYDSLYLIVLTYRDWLARKYC